MRPSATSVEHDNEVYASHVRTYDAEGRVSTHVLTPWLPPTYGSSTYTPLQITVGHSEGRPVSLTYAFPCGYGMTVSISREPGSGIETGRNYVFDDYRSIYSLSNTRDALSRPVAATDSFSGGWSFAYNNRSELTAAICPYYGSTGTPLTGGPCLYSYDTIGNRTASTVSAVTNSYTANALNQYTHVDSTALAYDDDGNLTSDGQFAYAYDCENRLVSVTPLSPSAGDLAIRNAYDHRSRRVQKTVLTYDGEDWLFDRQHTFVWDGWNIVLERIDYADFDVRFIEYYWGDDLSGSEQGAGGVGGLLAVSCDGTFYVPFYDCNGNIMGYVDEFGNVVARYAYDPFGKVVTSFGGTAPPAAYHPSDLDFYFGFSTKYHDREVGLIAYQLRSYSPRLGRWVNRDPIEEEGGLNLYAFCDNDAIASIDSLGLSKYWDNYMRYYVHDSSDVWKTVGGNLYWQHLTDEGYENSCALRVSRALVNSGESIPIAPGRWVAKDYTVKEDTVSRQGITFKKGTVLKAEKPGSRYELSAEKMKGCLDSVITGDKLKEKKMLLQNSKAVKYAESIENCNDEAFFVGYSTEGWWHTGMIKKDYKDHYLFTRNLMYVTFWRLKK